VLLMPDADDSNKVEPIIIRNQFIDQDNDPTATHWSKPGSNGLQVGVRLSPAEQTYRHGQVVDIEFLYRSVFTQPVPATLPAAFQFSKIRGIRLERVSFVKPTWPDGSRHTLIGSEPVVVKGHRMQICFDSDEELKPGVNLRAITRPDARHYVYFTVPNPGDESIDERLEIRERLYFSIPPLTPPKVLPLYESHYYRHWGFSVPGHRRPEQSTPDPTYIDPFQIGVSLSPAEKSRIPAYYASGFRVDKVAPHSPAEKVGIEVGDILLSWERNQFYGDDPTKPFANYKSLDNQLREFLENHSRPLAFGSGNMKFDLLDHRSGEIVHISPWFGDLANGGPNKAEILKRMAERKQLREQSE
ncbi:MAG: hypothetical protein KDB00_18695, partial [Planctomycetales bacterium]|nr:hypothetical protein [Planctomycetales bacterium]